MKNRRIVTGITILVILLYTGLVIGWHLYPLRENLTLQAPGAARTANDVVIGEFFMKYEEEASSSLTGKWSSFRGERTTNRIETSEQIRTSGEEYPVLWSVETGEGHAAPVIYNGRVYFLDYNEQLSSDALRCFSLETGQELWRRWYRVPIKRNHGFSRTGRTVKNNR